MDEALSGFSPCRISSSPFLVHLRREREKKFKQAIAIQKGKGIEKLGFSPWPSPTSSSPPSNPPFPRSPSSRIWHLHKKQPPLVPLPRPPAASPPFEGFPSFPLPPNRIAALPTEQATHPTHPPSRVGADRRRWRSSRA